MSHLRKPPSLNNHGNATGIAFGLMMFTNLLGIALLTISSARSGQANQSTLLFGAAEAARNNIVSVMESRAMGQATINYSQNNGGVFNCMFAWPDTGCAQTYVPTPPTPPHPGPGVPQTVLAYPDGQVFYDGSNPAAGFGFTGWPCNPTTNPFPNPNCPIHIDLYSRIACQGASPCRGTNIKVVLIGYFTTASDYSEIKLSSLNGVIQKR